MSPWPVRKRGFRWAQGRGLRIYAETCPQYLFLTAEDLEAPGFEAAKCVCSPPPRDRANQQVIWDPERTAAIRNDDLHHNVDYSPYEGLSVTGWPMITVSRGEVVHREGRPLDEAGRGRFLRCGSPEPARPKRRQREA